MYVSEVVISCQKKIFRSELKLMVNIYVIAVIIKAAVSSILVTGYNIQRSFTINILLAELFNKLYGDLAAKLVVL